MTFSDVRQKLISRFWWALVLILVLNVLSWGWMNSVKYNSLVSFKLNLDKDFYEISNIDQKIGSNIIFNENNFASSYTQNTATVSRYFQEFFLSGSAIARLKESDALTNSTIIDKPTYTITILGNAVVEVRNEFDTEDEAKKFNDAIVKLAKEEYTNWNQSKPEMLQIDLMEPDSKIVGKPKPIQLRILPTFAALIFSLALIIVIPNNEKKS